MLETLVDMTPNSDDGVPAAEEYEAGTYYVWYYAKGNTGYADSEIAGPVTVTIEETQTEAY